MRRERARVRAARLRKPFKLRPAIVAPCPPPSSSMTIDASVHFSRSSSRQSQKRDRPRSAHVSAYARRGVATPLGGRGCARVTTCRATRPFPRRRPPLDFRTRVPLSPALAPRRCQVVAFRPYRQSSRRAARSSASGALKNFPPFRLPVQNSEIGPRQLLTPRARRRASRSFSPALPARTRLPAARRVGSSGVVTSTRSANRRVAASAFCSAAR